MPFDSGQLNREHPFLFAQLQSSNDGTIVIGSGGRGSCELCHLNSPRGLAINQGYSTLAAARPHRIFTRRDMAHFTAGSACHSEPVLRGGYFSQTLRDGWPSPRHLLPFGVVTAVEQRLTFVAPAQMKPGLESKARFVL